ncbi:DNA topoisomerase 2-alpha [Trichinella spiralis]|uniref:DNA topoisomerase 2-alpha n=1 Tax=Trichinella spiralis TaxID=6334 RepID=UPI0001EFBE66|nr:DNA topoisomerase 2-alpha [Trichinella spiralis]
MPIYLANEHTIRTPEIFGKFGLIERIVIKPIPPVGKNLIHLYKSTVYMKYHNKEDGIKAVALGSKK